MTLLPANSNWAVPANSTLPIPNGAGQLKSDAKSAATIGFGNKVHKTSQGGDVPEWVLRRVDDVIAEHFFTMEKAIQQLQQFQRDQSQLGQQQQSYVQKALAQVAILLEAQTSERHKCQQLDHQMQDLQKELGEVKHANEDLLQRSMVWEFGLKTDQIDPSKLQSSKRSAKTSQRDFFQGADEILDQLEERLSVVEDGFLHLDELVRSLQDEAIRWHKSAKLIQKQQHISAAIFTLGAFDMDTAERSQKLEVLKTRETNLTAKMDQVVIRESIDSDDMDIGVKNVPTGAPGVVNMPTVISVRSVSNDRLSSARVGGDQNGSEQTDQTTDEYRQRERQSKMDKAISSRVRDAGRRTLAVGKMMTPPFHRWMQMGTS